MFWLRGPQEWVGWRSRLDWVALEGYMLWKGILDCGERRGGFGGGGEG